MRACFGHAAVLFRPDEKGRHATGLTGVVARNGRPHSASAGISRMNRVPAETTGSWVVAASTKAVAGSKADQSNRQEKSRNQADRSWEKEDLTRTSAAI